VHPARVKAELVATKPNQCWSWDIKLHGPAKWSYFHLYVIIDIYSRYVVGWLIAESESAVLAEKLLADTIAKHDRDQLTIHADNGSSMASKPVAFLLADLGVTKTHSRPHTSNDNPYSVTFPRFVFVGVVGDLSNVVFEASADTLMLPTRSRARLTPGREDHCQGGNALGGVDGYAADVG
jgi:transposase InsO family protein